MMKPGQDAVHLSSRQIAVRLGMAFAMLLAIVFTVGWLGLSRMNRANANLEDIFGRRWIKVRLAQQAVEYSNLNSRITTEVFLLNDPAQIRAHLAVRAENTARISELLAKIEAQCESEVERRLVEAVKSARTPYVAGYQQALHLLLDENNRNSAERMITQQATPALVKYHAAWINLLEFEAGRIDSAAQESQRQFSDTRRLTGLAILLAILVTGAIAVFTIYRMVAEITARLHEFSSLNRHLEREIEERRRMETELRELALVVESSSDFIGIATLDGCSTFVNRAGRNMVGLDRDGPLTSGSILDFVTEEERERHRNHILPLILRDGRWEGETEFRHWKTGSPVPLWQSVFLIAEEETGQPIAMATICRDISERKRAQGAIVQANQNFRALIEASPAAIMTLDQEGIVKLWNPAAEQLFGWTEQEVIGRPLPNVPEDQEGAFHQHLLGACQGVALPPEEAHRKRKDGSTVEVSISRAILRDSEGRVAGIVAVMEDITARKRAAEEMEQARAAAESASHAKSEFLANMSHEIRTPMNGIVGMTELLLDTELTPEQREYLGMVKSSADSLLTVINDILDFSKIEAGKMELDPIEFNVRNSVEDTARMLALKAHQKGLELITDVQPGVPEVLIGDPVRLRQILFNLLGNAVKFTDQGEVVLRVETREKTEHGICLRFSVKDTGIGIPEGRQQQIFEAFSQADGSTSRKYGGTGLGLTITSRLVNLMGGRVWVESEPGKGSTFHFTGEFGIGKVVRARVDARDTVDLRNLAVMVVDDNATNRQILRQTLLSWEMRPTLADGAREALGILQHAQKSGSPFSLVITDMQMPEMDGFTLAEQIKKNPALCAATIMMLTSAGRRGDGVRCRELGVKAYLTKPIKQSELHEAIVAALGGLGQTQNRDSLVTRHSLREARRHLRVLVAEDNRVNQVLTQRLLEQRGHTVVLANNGLEALAQAETSTFDVVLMDVQMPEMDGFEATRAVREKERASGKHLPIIALTAHAMAGDQQLCLDAGMDAYISKPIQSAELFAAMERVAPLPAEREEQSEWPGKRMVHSKRKPSK